MRFTVSFMALGHRNLMRLVIVLFFGRGSAYRRNWNAMISDGGILTIVNESQRHHANDPSQVNSSIQDWSFIFCRHGNSLSNQGRYHKMFYKSVTQFRDAMSDSDLSEKGKRQALYTNRLMADVFSKIGTPNWSKRPTNFISSGYRRADDTGKIIFGQRLSTTDPDLRERYMSERGTSARREKMSARITRFVMRYLKMSVAERPKVVVGHSSWYRQMLWLGGIKYAKNKCAETKNPSPGKNCIHKIANAQCRKMKIRYLSDTAFQVLEQTAFIGNGNDGDGITKAGEIMEEYMNGKFLPVLWTKESQEAICGRSLNCATALSFLS